MSKKVDSDYAYESGSESEEEVEEIKPKKKVVKRRKPVAKKKKKKKKVARKRKPVAKKKRKAPKKKKASKAKPKVTLIEDFDETSEEEWDGDAPERDSYTRTARTNAPKYDFDDDELGSGEEIEEKTTGKKRKRKVDTGDDDWTPDTKKQKR